MPPVQLRTRPRGLPRSARNHRHADAEVARREQQQEGRADQRVRAHERGGEARQPSDTPRASSAVKPSGRRGRCRRRSKGIGGAVASRRCTWGCGRTGCLTAERRLDHGPGVGHADADAQRHQGRQPHERLARSSSPAPTARPRRRCTPRACRVPSSRRHAEANRRPG